MSRRTTLVGLAALCVMAFSAVAASVAQAGATAYTCVKNPSVDVGHTWANAHCSGGTTGEYGHVEIKADETTQLTTTALSTGTLDANAFGAEIELTWNVVNCEECTAHNHAAGSLHEFTGSGGRIKLKNVEIGRVGPNCTVTDDSISENTHVFTTEPVKFTTTNATTVTLEPELGTTLAHFKIITAPGTHAKVCNLIGTFNLSGKVPLSLEGATATANVTKASGNLKLNEEEASLTGLVTVTAGKTVTPEEPNPVHNPIGLTET